MATAKASSRAKAPDALTVQIPAGVLKIQGASKGGKVRFYGTTPEGIGIALYVPGDLAREGVAAALALSGRAVTVAQDDAPSAGGVPTIA